MKREDWAEWAREKVPWCKPWGCGGTVEGDEIARADQLPDEASVLSGPPCTGSGVGRPCLDCDEECCEHPDHKEDAS